MKGLIIALGIVATAIYANGPANLPVLNRMAISVVSLKEQLNPTLCSKIEAIQKVYNQISLALVFTGQTGAGIHWRWDNSTKKLPEKTITECTGIIVLNNEPLKINYTVEKGNSVTNDIAITVRWS